MITTYVTPMPPVVFVADGPVLTVAGASLVLAGLVAVVAVGLGLFVQRALATRSRPRSILRVVPAGSAESARRAA